ncbi:MAG: apolipoprotein N-acyltransferase [Oceanospirillaceae bacterium]|nr:apolipoprotein N-acyltransferase [Oceanospirillaceae bacterium]
MRLRAFLALSCGAITTLSFAPFDLYAIALITPGALYLLLKNRSIKQAILLGWLFGLGFFGSGISWVYVSIHTYGYTPAPIAALLTFTFCAALAVLFLGQIYLYQKYFSRRYSALSFGVLWLLFEWLRSWLLTGFPWLYLGYATIDTPLSALASIGGVWLSSAIIISISLALAHAFENPTKRVLAIPISMLAIALLVSYLTPKDWTEKSGEPISIAILQPNIPQLTKWNRQYLDQILSQYYRTTLPLLGRNVIIWPETAIPSLYADVADYLAPLVERQASLGGSLISGIPSKVLDPDHPQGRRIHNSIFNLTEGTIYHKQRLVPFGEYIPLQESFRELFNFLNIPDFTFSRPKVANQALLKVGNYRYSTAICYEIAYPELVRQYSKNADLILTLSNDTWFSHSIGPDQHFQMARMRALENGRWLIRSANNGISAIVNPQGKVVKIAPRYQAAVLMGEVQPMQGLTPYQRIGQWPLISLYFVLLIFGALKNRNSRLTF